ncbi:nucleotidyltransferase family protein [Spirosoma foliorum]|uniref:Nucleotidyltransferase domain-containing protein n=1 Tax=Spirosoma foliorum TaxID=2710596 RepID=A0A7G5H1T1_9BACT|nr:nucleotidyltransferase domain-containing protein [Spirosoma foliorum]QMW05073.1 nucleotidyltransferase domain-containing protein [Spirosoma foliorum]
MPVNDFQSLQTYLRDKQIFDRFGLTRIGVFGSFVRGESYRDIDLLIDENIPYKQLIALRDALQTDLHIPIDLMLQAYAEPIILHRALADVRYATQS